MTLYQVRAERSGQWWALSVPDLPGVFSQAKNLHAAETAITDAIALYLDVDPSTVAAVVTPELDDVVAKKVRMRSGMVYDLAQMQHAVAHLSREVALDLLGAGLSQRDAAHVLGVSFQRVNQLVQ